MSIVYNNVKVKYNFGVNVNELKTRVGTNIMKKVIDDCQGKGNLWSLLPSSPSGTQVNNYNYSHAMQDNYCVEFYMPGSAGTVEVFKDFDKPVNLKTYSEPRTNNYATITAKEERAGEYPYFYLKLAATQEYNDPAIWMNFDVKIYAYPYNPVTPKYAKFSKQIYHVATTIGVYEDIGYGVGQPGSWTYYNGFSEADFENIGRIEIIFYRGSCYGKVRIYLQEVGICERYALSDNPINNHPSGSIFVSRHFGDDQNSGTFRSRPVRTLGRALEIVEQNPYLDNYIVIMDSEIYKENIRVPENLSSGYLIQIEGYHGQSPKISGEYGITDKTEVGARPYGRRKYYRGMGTTWYVSKSGLDSPGRGTRDDPFLTISYAYNIAADGDCIEILDSGEYNEALDFTAKGITLQASLGVTPIISTEAGHCIQIGSHTYYIYGITFRGTQFVINNGYRAIYGTGLNGGGLYCADSTFSNFGLFYWDVPNIRIVELIGAGNGSNFDIDFENCHFYENGRTNICIYNKLLGGKRFFLNNLYERYYQIIFYQTLGNNNSLSENIYLIANEIERASNAEAVVPIHSYLIKIYGESGQTMNGDINVVSCKLNRYGGIYCAHNYLPNIEVEMAEFNWLEVIRFIEGPPGDLRTSRFYANLIYPALVLNGVVGVDYIGSSMGGQTLVGDFRDNVFFQTYFNVDPFYTPALHELIITHNIFYKSSIFYKVSKDLTISDCVFMNITNAPAIKNESQNTITCYNCWFYNNSMGDTGGSGETIIDNTCILSEAALNPGYIDIDNLNIEFLPDSKAETFGDNNTRVGVENNFLVDATYANGEFKLFNINLIGNKLQRGVRAKGISFSIYGNDISGFGAALHHKASNYINQGKEFKNNILHDNCYGVYQTKSTVVENIIAYNNMYGMYMTAETINHVTLVDNQYGLTIGGAISTIKNSIMYNNAEWDYNGRSVTEYCIIGKRVFPETEGDGDTSADPLFVNSSYNIVNRIIGYDLDSPAYRSGDDGKDRGAWSEIKVKSTITNVEYTFRDNPREIIPYITPVNLVEKDTVAGILKSNPDAYVEELLFRWGEDALINVEMKAVLEAIYKSQWVLAVSFDGGATWVYCKNKKSQQFTIRQFRYLTPQLPYGDCDLYLRVINFNENDYIKTEY